MTEFFPSVPQPVAFAGSAAGEGLAYRVYDPTRVVAGTIKEVLVQIGSKVGEGTVLIKVETGASASVAAPVAQAPAPTAAPAAISAPVSASTATNAPVAVAPGLPAGSKVHASPSVRAYARELGVDLSKVAAMAIWSP